MEHECEECLPVVSLFSGSGGLDTGFMRAGFTPILAVDGDSAAVDTFHTNYPAVPVIMKVCLRYPQSFLLSACWNCPERPGQSGQLEVLHVRPSLAATATRLHSRALATIKMLYKRSVGSGSVFIAKRPDWFRDAVKESWHQGFHLALPPPHVRQPPNYGGSRLPPCQKQPKRRWYLWFSKLFAARISESATRASRRIVASPSSLFRCFGSHRRHLVNMLKAQAQGLSVDL